MLCYMRVYLFYHSPIMPRFYLIGYAQHDGAVVHAVFKDFADVNAVAQYILAHSDEFARVLEWEDQPHLIPIQSALVDELNAVGYEDDTSGIFLAPDGLLARAIARMQNPRIAPIKEYCGLAVPSA